ncbi:DUF4326 domain-containing protein [Dickeya dianthicola]|uniref:DUF4326 domain-containing protein n=1 Tax=Dickeya dianthicola TaxID=204039 RepID=UPI001F61CA52|nr:DUF4326 domain-containing protein [Dickeya dianthicola]MCI4032933.1 DUF4326 domain-containing protein [Dickeya dianthicola]MCI4173142.1 DUF4326 domain-containing protein [Dickeya dianthicola]MCI4177237.1 DUF4326 domain-containing protein [Dickeya dianthicola]MCI4183637.1 DUF4326 domain-containing protein [Dickeya dianthicola]MCI4196993.1 DUF4326 domain-containing protein [Dickeya dianthicola]
MSNILILYPKEFNCITKFNRKIDNVLSGTVQYTLCYLNGCDYRNFTRQYAQDKSIKIISLDDMDFNIITHAIIFDDGEVFLNEYKKIKDNNIPLRTIKIKITRVINIKKDKEFSAVKSNSRYEYIGRGGYWGNPYAMHIDGDREEVIRKFKYDFDFDKFPNITKDKVYELAGKRLGCFCKPAPCHGDVIADFLNSWDDGE